MAAISLRDLADRVDLRQPSLYAYFDSKLALYDAMFVDAFQHLLETSAGHPPADDPREALVEFVELCVRFATEDVVRHQLVFQRTILVDKTEDFVVGFSKLEVIRRARSEQVRDPYRDFVKPGVRFVQSTITTTSSSRPAASTPSSTAAGPRTPARRERGPCRLQTRSSSSMRMALPRRILYFLSSSRPSSIFSQYSFELGHVVSVWG